MRTDVLFLSQNQQQWVNGEISNHSELIKSTILLGLKLQADWRNILIEMYAFQNEYSTEVDKSELTYVTSVYLIFGEHMSKLQLPNFKQDF